MALTRGKRLQSANTSRAEQSIIADRSGTDQTQDVSMDVGNSNIEISESGIHPIDTSEVGNSYLTGTSSNSGMYGEKGDSTRKRGRNQDSYDESYSYIDSTTDSIEPDFSQNMKNNRVRRNHGRFHSLYNSIKSFFFTSTEPNLSMKRKLRKKRKYYSKDPQSRHLHSPKSLRRRSENNVSGMRDKKSMRDQVLQRERQNRNMIQSGNFVSPPDVQRRLTLTNDSLSSKVNLLQRQLNAVSEDLKFAKEKNALFEKLLDDANVDRSYVKSRRDIRNLEKRNIKPQDELPPSPERKVNPLVTSSPIHRVSTDHTESRNLKLAPPKINFYSKYPTIPRTESLVMGANLDLGPDHITDNTENNNEPA
ncbi:hypothetical protein, no similarity [Maudiozyma barnettii]|mgnify:CR=1 FL=1|uniref:Uncharacterized protein n=1 Tax=Maudiozyma barnettii TaxID=61262 RepID=A0A8H2VEZ9_9SACH|nr:hypothetical protein, no similarity [Kazachstania barnettii]CAB4253918.1 hypothetical protein, no similarity [Kazachstania barnettii]CAD1781668.1 hypothetical protein, no similarity [Kazachstania barnettii]